MSGIKRFVKREADGVWLVDKPREGRPPLLRPIHEKLIDEQISNDRGVKMPALQHAAPK